jgi:hypothetical protein
VTQPGPVGDRDVHNDFFSLALIEL